jgi:hypothetical protein
MNKRKSPLLGYNHNLQYKGRIYHVQTEDSGLKSPHVFTHLFHDGIIVSSKKKDYKHLVEVEDSDEQVRKLMQELHKDMMKELMSGVHDDKIVQYFGTLEGDDDQARAEAMSATKAVPNLPPAQRQSQAAAPPAPVAPPRPPPSPPPSQPQQRPAVVAMPMVVVSGQPPRAPAPAPPASPPAAQDPAAVFQPQKSKAVPESIFSEGVMADEKSLDEVILAYLAEDLPED